MSGVALYDLLNSGQPSRDERCDICVIGAGAAGVYLATGLASKGLDVIVVEAGDSVCRDSAEVGFDSGFLDEFYPGAVEGRAFGLGGTTARWGGLLVPHSRHDLRKPDDIGCSPWLHVFRTVSEKAGKVLMTLGYRGPGEFTDFPRKQLGAAFEALGASGLDVVASLFLPFRFKNMAFLLNTNRSNRTTIRVFLNAVAKSWTVEADEDHGARVTRLMAVAQNGNTLKVASQRFVIAAGAIESARILLELGSLSSRPVLRATAAVGRYLADHLSVRIADVAPPSRPAAIRLFAPRFSKGWMRSFRFLESDPPSSAPRAFSHFIFENESPGFLLAKEVLGALQQRRRPKVTCSEVAYGTSGVLALAYARYLRSTLYVSAKTSSHFQLDIEQVPIRDNGISLGREKDRYGRQKAVIRWRVSELDLLNIRTTAARILSKWPGAKKHLPDLIATNTASDSIKPHDAYHPVGVCRMGDDPEAVVDYNLKVWGVSNLWAVNTGILPSAGTANPTFSMLCMAQALCEHLADGAANS